MSFVEVLAPLVNALAEYERASQQMIMTSEHRQRIEDKARNLAAQVQTALPMITELFAQSDTIIRRHNDTTSKALRERDKLVDRVEAAENTLRLWQKTREHLPAVGIWCDEKDCTSAVGIVGVRAVSLDQIGEPLSVIAAAAGWVMIDGKQLCPKCKEKQT